MTALVWVGLLTALLGSRGDVAAAGPSSVHAASSRDSPEVVTTVTWGFGGAVAAGRLSPIQVGLTAGQLAVTGDLTVRLVRTQLLGSTTVTHYTFPVRLAAHSAMRVWLVVPVDAQETSLSVQLPGIPEDPLPDRLFADRLVARPITVIFGSAETEGAWRAAASNATASGEPAPQVAFVESPAEVPPWALAYEGVELVVLTPSFPAERLTGAQISALQAFVRSGGRLVAADAAGSRWRRSPLGEWLVSWKDAGRRGVTFIRHPPGENGSPPNGQGATPAAGRFVPAAEPDPLQAELVAAMLGQSHPPAPVWPRLLGGAAYTAAVYAGLRWGRRIPRRLRVAAGFAAWGTALLAGAAGGAAVLAANERVLAVLVVRGAPSTAGEAGTSGGPLRAELYAALPGAELATWEVRPAPGMPDILPAPAIGDVSGSPPPHEVAWVGSAPSEGEGGPMPAVWAVRGGGVVSFLVDAPPVELVRRIAPQPGLAAALPGGAGRGIASDDLDWDAAGRHAITARAGALRGVEPQGPVLAPGFLSARLREHLLPARQGWPPAEWAVDVLAAHVERQMVGPEGAGSPAYVVAVSPAVTPEIQVRRSGSLRWQPVYPLVLLAVPLLPGGVGEGARP